jgi:hypothetical protein
MDGGGSHGSEAIPPGVEAPAEMGAEEKGGRMMLTAEAQAEIERVHAKDDVRVQRLLEGPVVGESALWVLAHRHREALLAQVRLLGNTLQSVCEDAFSKDNCPAECDSYGHVEECGAVSAAAHARQLATRVQQAETAVRRLRAAAKELQQWGATPASACWCTPQVCPPPAPARVHSPGCDAMHIALAFTATVVPA